jgi:hypothetical protein
MPTPYDASGWADETTLGRRIFNHNVRLTGREAPGWTLVKVAPMHRDERLAETAYLLQEKSPDGARRQVRVGIHELPDWRAAHQQLLAILAHAMRPDLPRAAGRLAALGDVAFVAAEPRTDIPAAISFTRGNVAVTLSSVGGTTADVSPIAAAIDQALKDPPAKSPALRRRARPTPPETVEAAGALIDRLSSHGDAWVKALVPDGELHRRGEALVYTPAEPGRKAVQVFVVPTAAR